MLLHFSFDSDSEAKMGDELTLLMEVFHKIEKAGGQATLSVSTAGGKTKVKLEVATTPAPPSVSPTTSSSPGRRHRRRSGRARARRNQRAAAHQASLAKAATSVSLEDPPSRRPLHLLHSPPPASGRRRVMSVGRPEMPTFSSLNLDGCSSPTPAPPPPPPPVCYEHCEIPRQHCDDCGKCDFLCSEHFGCDCEEPYFEPYEIECAICYCTREVRLM